MFWKLDDDTLINIHHVAAFSKNADGSASMALGVSGATVDLTKEQADSFWSHVTVLTVNP